MRGRQISDMHVTGPGKAATSDKPPCPPALTFPLKLYSWKVAEPTQAYLLTMFMIEHPV